MIHIYFSPWKSGSTNLITSAGKIHGYKFKEIFHEDRYEATEHPEHLQDIYPIYLKDLSLSWRKFSVDNRNYSESFNAFLRRILNRLSEINNEKSIAIQIAESFELALSIHEQALSMGVASDLRIVKFSAINQACSIFHNYLECNPYFVANALLISIFNTSNPTTERLQLFLKKLSITGMILVAQRIVQLMPRHIVLSTISTYSKIICAHQSSIGNKFKTLNQDEDKILELKQRYLFISFEVQNALNDARAANITLEFLDKIDLGLSVLSNLPIQRKILPEPQKLHLLSTQKILNDRIFTTNLCIGTDGECFPLNTSDDISISTTTDNPIYIKNILLIGGQDIKNVQLMLDGTQINITLDKESTDTRSKIYNYKILVLSVDHACQNAIYLTMRCQTSPRIHLESRVI